LRFSFKYDVILFTSCIIAIMLTVVQPIMAAMAAYFDIFISGGLAPFWPHAALLSISVFASFAVGIGIVLERPKYESLHKIAFWLVMGGIVVEALCTILLFAFDEGISSAQQSKIIALETVIAPRDLDADAQKALAKQLAAFSGKTVLVTSYLLDLEAAWLGQKIIQALRLAGIRPISALACEAAVGGLTVAIHVTGSDAPLVNALLASLPKFGLESVGDPNPVMWLHCPNEDVPGIDATIFVAIKRPLPLP
jgi:hypothetical protein